MATDAEKLIEQMVEAGDHRYATAYAILQLKPELHAIYEALGWIGMHGPANTPGALEFIGMQMKRIADDAECRDGT